MVLERGDETTVLSKSVTNPVLAHVGNLDMCNLHLFGCLNCRFVGIRNRKGQ